jgi:hypothetical protein
LFTAQPQAPAAFKSRRLRLGGKRLNQHPVNVFRLNLKHAMIYEEIAIFT